MKTKPGPPAQALGDALEEVFPAAANAAGATAEATAEEGMLP